MEDVPSTFQIPTSSKKMKSFQFFLYIAIKIITQWLKNKEQDWFYTKCFYFDEENELWNVQKWFTRI